MPCRDYQLDRYARHLCEAMYTLERAGKLGLVSKSLNKWWTGHKISDAQAQQRKLNRIKDAKDKNKLLAELTARERKLLGV